MNKGLTLTLVFEAMSLNYGEGVGNISELKKLTRSGDIFTYLSRQAIRYDIFRMLKETFQIDEGKNPLTGDNTVVQFSSESNIRDYIEADLFGYMKTKKGVGSLTRSSIVRISPAIALESFCSDLEWGTNKNFADRMGVNPNPFQFEHQYSLYSYTITIDLNKVGKDDHDKIDLDSKDKADRVKKLLEVVKVLNREIKGRTESLNPVFAIGGVYNIKNPFFLNRIKINYNKEKQNYSMNTEILKSSANLVFNKENIKDFTKVGYLSNYWSNEEEISKIVDKKSSFNNLNTFFDTIIQDMESSYIGKSK